MKHLVLVGSQEKKKIPTLHMRKSATTSHVAFLKPENSKNNQHLMESCSSIWTAPWHWQAQSRNFPSKNKSPFVFFSLESIRENWTEESLGKVKYDFILLFSKKTKAHSFLVSFILSFLCSQFARNSLRILTIFH